VQPKASWAGLICRTCQYYTSSDCQSNERQYSRRSAWGGVDSYGGKTLRKRRF